MPQHPVVVIEHPMASKTEAEVLAMAEAFRRRPSRVRSYKK